MSLIDFVQVFCFEYFLKTDFSNKKNIVAWECPSLYQLNVGVRWKVVSFFNSCLFSIVIKCEKLLFFLSKKFFEPIVTRINPARSSRLEKR